MWFLALIPLIKALIPVATTLGGMAMSRREMKKAGKHAYERQLGLQYQQMINAKELDIEQMRAMTELNESRLKLVEGSSFQKGSYTGPYFQVVQK